MLRSFACVTPFRLADLTGKMPLEVAAPVALMSLAPIGGKMAVPAFFKAGGAGLAGKSVGATTFAGVKGMGAGKAGIASGKGGIFREAAKKKIHEGDHEETVQAEAVALFALLSGKTPASDELKAGREQAGSRRVVLSRRGDRSRMYGEFL